MIERSIPLIAIIATALLLCIPTSLSAQLTGEWLVVDSTHAGYGNSIPWMIESAARGHYVVATHENSSVGPFVLWRTTDAGATWRAVRADSGDNWRIYGLAHPTPRVILATGYRMEPSGGSSSLVARSLVLRSSDGGATWSETRLPDHVRAEGLSMCDSLNGAFVAYRWSSSGRHDLSAHVTTDGGATWLVRPIDSAGITASRIFCRTQGSYLMPAYDGVAKQAFGFHTSDNGATWTRREIPSTIARIDFIDSATGWSAHGVRTGIGDTERDLILRTTDGGATWTTVIDSLIDFRFGLRGISFADRDHGIAVGGYGKILRTTDGGATWIRDWPSSEKVAEYIDLLGVAHAAPDEAIALSGYGIVLGYRGRQRLAAPWITAPRENTAELPFELDLTWTPITGAQWYDVEIGDTTYEFNFVDHRIFDEPYLRVWGMTTTSLRVQLAPRTRYVFRVRARNEHDSSDWSVRLSTITRAAGQTLTTPSFTLPSMGATDVPVPTRMEWTPIAGATVYDLLVCDNPGFVGAGLVELRDVATTSVIAPLAAGTEYWAIVRARNGSETGSWSNVTQGKHRFRTASTSGIDGDAPGARGARPSLSIAPNPSDGGNARITLASISTGRVRVRLVDALGRTIRELFTGIVDAGGNQIEVDLGNLPSAVYSVLATTDTATISNPLIITR